MAAALTRFQKLDSWFRREAGKRERGGRVPWCPLLKSLREVEGVPPRVLPPWQFWMSRRHDLVNEEYDRLHPDTSSTKRSKDIGERCRIARILWSKLDSEEQITISEFTKNRFVYRGTNGTFLLRHAFFPKVWESWLLLHYKNKRPRVRVH